MIGISSPTFCQVPFMNMLEKISEHFQLWELLSEGEDALEMIRDGVRYGRESLDMSFQAHVPISDVNIGSVHEPMRLAAMNEVKQTIMMCHQLEIPLATVHPGFIQGIAFLNKAKALEKTKDSVKELAAFARDNSVVIAIENMPANINGTCTTAAELLEVVDSAGLGICFDMGHANTSGQIDEFLKVAGRFKNVHLHNNEGAWDQHNEVDDGTADIKKVIGVLEKSYNGNLVIESTDLEPGVKSKRKLEMILGDLSAP
jgi:sugar phosphate isomerase/epimerase